MPATKFNGYGRSHARIPGHCRPVSSLDHELVRFIAASFPSVWALELLLVLRREPRVWSPEELVATLRASELVVSKSLDSLLAGGLASMQGGGVRYMPVSDEVARNVDRMVELYSARPDAVRRVIVSTSTGDLTAFADAFRLRKN